MGQSLCVKAHGLVYTGTTSLVPLIKPDRAHVDLLAVSIAADGEQLQVLPSAQIALATTFRNPIQTGKASGSAGKRKTD